MAIFLPILNFFKFHVKGERFILSTEVRKINKNLARKSTFFVADIINDK